MASSLKLPPLERLSSQARDDLAALDGQTADLIEAILSEGKGGLGPRERADLILRSHEIRREQALLLGSGSSELGELREQAARWRRRAEELEGELAEYRARCDELRATVDALSAREAA